MCKRMPCSKPCFGNITLANVEPDWRRAVRNMTRDLLLANKIQQRWPSVCVCVDVPILSEIAVSTMPRLSLAGCEAAGYLLSCHLERPYSKQRRVQQTQVSKKLSPSRIWMLTATMRPWNWGLAGQASDETSAPMETPVAASPDPKAAEPTDILNRSWPEEPWNNICGLLKAVKLVVILSDK